MFVEIFDRQFLDLHKRSCELILKIPEEKLYWQPGKASSLFPMNSCGECILRSAGTVEQTFGGITTRLWDDPFEWTLPEALSTKEKILQYLEEVEQTRQRGFALFTSDEDLKKQIPAPVTLKPLFQILLETLARAEHFQGRAFAISQLLLDRKQKL
jgi:hypothetical protein